MPTENIDQPLKATKNTSYFQTFAVCALVGPALVMGWLWLAAKVLTPDDAATFKMCLLGLWAILTGGSGGASLIGGVARTFGKIDLQKAQATAPDAGAIAEQALQNLVAKSGFDVREFNIGAAPLAVPGPSLPGASDITMGANSPEPLPSFEVQQ